MASPSWEQAGPSTRVPQGSFRSSRQTTACQLLWTPSAFRFDPCLLPLADELALYLGHHAQHGDAASLVEHPGYQLASGTPASARPDGPTREATGRAGMVSSRPSVPGQDPGACERAIALNPPESQA